MSAMVIDRAVVEQALESLEARCGTFADERQPGGVVPKLRAALAALGGDDTRVDLHLPEPQLHRSEPPLNRLEPGFEPRLNRSEPSLNRSEPGVVQGAFLPAQSLRQLLEALHIGLAAAHEVTILFHADMRGYRGDMHRLHEDREQQVLEALKLVQLTINQMAAIDEAAVG
jgi:hypothetical protein